MPKKFPPEFKRDVVAVARRGDLTMAGVAALRICESVRLDAVLPAARGALGFEPLLVRAGDAFGEVVNRTARITKLATPGSVVADAVTAKALSGRFHTAPLGSHQIRGVSEHTDLMEVSLP